MNAPSTTVSSTPTFTLDLDEEVLVEASSPSPCSSSFTRRGEIRTSGTLSQCSPIVNLSSRKFSMASRFRCTSDIYCNGELVSSSASYLEPCMTDHSSTSFSCRAFFVPEFWSILATNEGGAVFFLTLRYCRFIYMLQIIALFQSLRTSPPSQTVVPLHCLSLTISSSLGLTFRITRINLLLNSLILIVPPTEILSQQHRPTTTTLNPHTNPSIIPPFTLPLHMFTSCLIPLLLTYLQPRLCQLDTSLPTLLSINLDEDIFPFPLTYFFHCIIV